MDYQNFISKKFLMLLIKVYFDVFYYLLGSWSTFLLCTVLTVLSS